MHLRVQPVSKHTILQLVRQGQQVQLVLLERLVPPGYKLPLTLLLK
jgi:hypothetical protein